MRKLIAFIPHLFTLGNLFCGCLAIIFAFEKRLDLAFYTILMGAFLDFFDGFFARILKVTGELGKQLDSLADVVSFGVAPAIMMLVFTDRIFDAYGVECMQNDFLQFQGIKDIPVCSFDYTMGLHPLSYTVLIIALFSAFRLAKFNIDARQTHGFIGLPTPANAMFLSSYIFSFLYITKNLPFQDVQKGWTIYPPLSANEYFVPTLPIKLESIIAQGNLFQIIYHPYFLIIISLVFSILLVSEIPLFALKFKNFSWGDNKVRYIFLILSAALLIIFQLFAIPFIIILYIIISVINNIFNRGKFTLST